MCKILRENKYRDCKILRENKYSDCKILRENKYRDCNILGENKYRDCEILGKNKYRDCKISREKSLFAAASCVRTQRHFTARQNVGSRAERSRGQDF